MTTEIIQKPKFNTFHLFIALYVLVLWLFPNQNQTGDAYGYAFSMESGQFLTSPHHLFYNWLGYYIAQVFPGLALFIMVKINTLLMGASLILLFRMLTQLTSSQKAQSFVVFTAFCFASLRFAGLNETYIIPLFHSLLGSYLLLNQSHAIKIFIGFAFLALAVLFHQIHVFWLLAWAIAYTSQSKKHTAAIIMVFISIGITYLGFALANNSNLWQFITQDVQNGLVETSIGKDNFIFTAINMVRTILQVHGHVFELLTIYPLMWLNVIVLFLSIGLFFYFKGKSIIPWTESQPFYLAATLAFFMHLAFGFYSVGNAEFMVMLPFLAVLSFGRYIHFSAKSITILATGIGVWNMSFYVIPKNVLNDTDNEQIRILLQENNAKYFVAHDRTEFTNYMDWQNSLNHLSKSIEILDVEKDSTLIASIVGEQVVYTNAVDYPKTKNRRSMIESKSKFPYKCTKIKSLSTWRGPIFLSVIDD
jgi:hypothetical protein